MHRLDGERIELPQGPEGIHETSVCEINIAGIPGLTVPAGAYASGSLFGLIFIGRPFAEAEIIGLGHAYEQATRHRKPPAL